MFTRHESINLNNPLYHQIAQDASPVFELREAGYFIAHISELDESVIHIPNNDMSIKLKLYRHHISVYALYNELNFHNAYHYTAEYQDIESEEMYKVRVYFSNKTKLKTPILLNSLGEKLSLSETPESFFIQLATQYAEPLITSPSQNLQNSINDLLDKQSYLLGGRATESTEALILLAEIYIQKTKQLIDWGVPKKTFSQHAVKMYTRHLKNSLSAQKSATQDENDTSELTQLNESDSDNQDEIIYWPSLAKLGFYKKQQNKTNHLEKELAQSFARLKMHQDQWNNGSKCFTCRQDYINVLDYHKEARQVMGLILDEKNETPTIIEIKKIVMARLNDICHSVDPQETREIMELILNEEDPRTFTKSQKFYSEVLNHKLHAEPQELRHVIRLILNEQDAHQVVTESKAACVAALTHMIHATDSHFILLKTQENCENLLEQFIDFAPEVTSDDLLKSVIKRNAPQKIEWLLHYGRYNIHFSERCAALIFLATEKEHYECLRALLRNGISPVETSFECTEKKDLFKKLYTEFNISEVSEIHFSFRNAVAQLGKKMQYFEPMSDPASAFQCKKNSTIPPIDHEQYWAEYNQYIGDLKSLYANFEEKLAGMYGKKLYNRPSKSYLLHELDMLREKILVVANLKKKMSQSKLEEIIINNTCVASDNTVNTWQLKGNQVSAELEQNAQDAILQSIRSTLSL